jgi:hypothetical protein
LSTKLLAPRSKTRLGSIRPSHVGDEQLVERITGALPQARYFLADPNDLRDGRARGKVVIIV